MPANPRVEELLEELLDSGDTPEEACRACPELLPQVRARWQRLRALKAEVGALFPPSPGFDGATPPPLPTADLPRIRGYEVQGVLGRGGMGVVYQALHLRLNRPVALKMLLAGAYAQPQELERFLREAETVAGLRHANIVQVLEAGDVDGRPYFTMEFVEGGSLAQKLAGTPPPPRQAAALVAVVAEAVHAAHRRGVVHRDLKPGNILLTADGTPKLTDFGLARCLEGTAGLTQSGAPLGTPSYMAPEQARGQTDAVGPASDIYALGAILYELLMGRPPFRGETAAETVLQVIFQEPAPPCRRNGQVPRDLETICLKCLRKEPHHRYASAQDLADDLRRFLEGKPVRARPVGAAERAVKWARRRPAAALLVAALLVIAGLAAWTVLWLRQNESDRQAAKAQRQGKACEVIETALGRADDLRRAERWPEALRVLTEAATQLPEAGSPPLEERLRQAQSDLRIAADLEHVRESSPLQPDGGIDYSQRAAEYQEAFDRVGLRIGDAAETVAASMRASAIRDQLVAAADDRAVVEFMVNDGPLVERLLRIAQLADPEPRWRDRFRDPAVWRSRERLLQLADDAFRTSPLPPGRQLALLGLLLMRAKAFGPSAQLLGEACRHEPSNFWLNREMGNALFRQAQFVESAAYCRAALALRPDNAGVHEALGMALFRAGQTDPALAEYRRAVELSPTSCSPRTRLVHDLAEVGYWKDAEDECRRAVEIDPASYLAPRGLALVLWEHHRYEGAVVLFRKVIEISPDDVQAYTFLGESLMGMGRHDGAVTALRKVTELTPVDANVRYLLAHELAEIGHPEEAITELQSASVLAPTMSFYMDLGTLLRAQGRPEEAAAAFQKAADLNSQSIAALDGLAASLLDEDRFAEARAATQRMLGLPATDAAHRAQQRRLNLCDSLLSVDADLPAILAGKERPTKVSTQLALADWCLKHRRVPATAAGFYDAALAAEPALADDLEAGNRFDAASAAAAAGCGVGQDAAELDGQRRAALRRQALDWLTAEYDAWTARHRLGKRGDRMVAATAVRAWLQNKDMAGVRDEQALAKLPLDERRSWQTLWADVAALAARDPVALFDQARLHVSRREWREAAECYADGLELEPTDDGDIWFECAASHLLMGDRSGYRRTCGHMLARCQVTPQMRPYLVARACTLAPDSADDPALPGRLSADELLRSSTAFWSLTEQAALRIRVGQSSEAVPQLEASLAADGRPGRAVLNWLWLALAYQKMGKADEARRQLDKAASWLDQQGDRMPLDTSTLGMHRHNWLEAHVLLQEAKVLIR